MRKRIGTTRMNRIEKLGEKSLLLLRTIWPRLCALRAIRKCFTPVKKSVLHCAFDRIAKRSHHFSRGKKKFETLFQLFNSFEMVVIET